MLKIYVYDQVKDAWIEEENLLFEHDTCAILNEKDRKIYLWKGPKCNSKKYKRGRILLKNLIEKFEESNIELIYLGKDIPPNIKEKIDSMLESLKKERQFEKYKFSHFFSIRIYFLSTLLNVFLILGSLINLARAFFLPIMNGNIAISANFYQEWLDISRILFLLAFISFLINFSLGIYEMEVQVVMISLNGIIILIGILLYLGQGIFIFLFQDGSSATLYLIKQSDISLFFSLILVSSLIIEIPNLIKFLNFIRTYKSFIL